MNTFGSITYEFFNNKKNYHFDLTGAFSNIIEESEAIEYDDDDDEDEFGNKGEVDADGADDFDNELMISENNHNDHRRRRERAWLAKATGEAPETPFNSAGKKNVKSKKQQQPRQKRR